MVGIYKITNTVSQKVYIGQSVNMLSRWRQHMESIMQHTGFTENEPEEEIKLENFTFSIVEQCLPEQLDEREAYWIAYYNSAYLGYNKYRGIHLQKLTFSPDERKAEEKNWLQQYQSFVLKDKDTFFTDIEKVIETLSPEKNTGIWCYTSRIHCAQSIVKQAEKRGFKAIELHSRNNTDYPLNSEQKRVLDTLFHTGMIPEEYNFVVSNGALFRGFSLRDQRFTKLIVNSLNTVAQEQAGRMVFPYSRALKTYAEAIDDKYLNRWLTLDECRDLAEEMAVPVPSKSKKHLTYVDEKIEPMSWNKLKDFLPSIGYEVEKNRKVLEKNGKQQIVYRITGEWQPFIPTDEDFLAMLEEKGE